MAAQFVPSALSNPSARRNPVEWSEVVKQWDQYKACAAKGDKRSFFYHPRGMDFHVRARSKCGGALPANDAVNCGPTGSACNDKWNQFKSKLDEFNRSSEYPIDILEKEWTYDVSPKSLLDKLTKSVQAQAPSETPLPSTSSGYLPAPAPSADDLPAELPVDDMALVPEEEGSMMMPLLIGGAVLLALGGGFLILRAKKKKKVSA